MNVNIPAFNPVMPALKDRQSGTAGEVGNARSGTNSQQTERGTPNLGQDMSRNSPEAAHKTSMTGRNDSALASEARLQVAREGSEAPQGFGADRATLSQLAMGQTPQAQLNDPQAGQQGPNNFTARPDADQATLQPRQQALLRAFGDAAAPQGESQRILNEQV
ncbi:hypothetical protein [Ectothiorhodospira sp. BSL-9]|uniref:hypothetical protein n=1 Tax=Ectothiorhodospira sp. BSL-9 TaxID=1442136 RepID=UPI0007B4234A|nr:hypothetical protein [Ectothiorhodospira sp. BSL-9]ANB01807.1 hypothetical protein ECTOBSL9_1013 [Ectothiorhodospira sp. BSL-9]TVQ73766.1 MAG: hypothetical protein EA372_04530 [Chromatiaceae bacterium]